jgi:hypothetical protein
MCVCLCILASSRIPDMILEDKLLISEVVLSHKDPPKTIQIGVAPRQSINPRGAPHPPERQLEDTLAFAGRHDETTLVRRLCALDCHPQFIGRCRRQASPSTSNFT